MARVGVWLIGASGEPRLHRWAGGAGVTGRLADRTIAVSYRFWNGYSLFAQYQLTDVENRNFRAGDDGLDHLLRFELTRSFR